MGQISYGVEKNIIILWLKGNARLMYIVVDIKVKFLLGLSSQYVSSGCLIFKQWQCKTKLII